MGTLIPTGLDAPIKLWPTRSKRGGHVGMLVDQYYVRGVDVTFFGRTCKANPLIARLARHFDCPIHGIARGPAARAIASASSSPRRSSRARDADGTIDMQGTMQAITIVVEGWVREHPEQWLWLHRRWR